jgi:prepilin-type N-terminal cleavage/methylation domain-containing protein
MSRRKDARAFTMLELIAVFSIMAILALLGYGLASPMIKKTNTQSAETVISLVVAAQQRHLLENGMWAAQASDLAVGRGAVVVTRAASEAGEVSMTVNGTNVVIATVDQSGTCLARLLRDPLVSPEPETLTVVSGEPCDADLLLGGIAQ